MALAGQTAWADTGQTVTVDGTVVSGFVSRLTFEGDNVVLTFDGGTVQTADMSLVSIDLTYTDDGPSAITEVNTPADNTVRVYTISGQYAGNTIDGLARGLYIVNGKKVIIK